MISLQDDAFSLGLTQIALHNNNNNNNDNLPLQSCSSTSPGDSNISSSNGSSSVSGSSSSGSLPGNGYDLTFQGQGQVIQTHGVLGEPQGQEIAAIEPHLEHMSRQDTFQLRQTLQQQQQQQQQEQQQQQQRQQQQQHQRRHLSPCECQQAHQSECMHRTPHSHQHHHHHHPRNHPNHPHHHLHHPNNHHSQQQQQHDTYFHLSGQPEIEYDNYEQPALSQPSVLDSPPNSEEPYSPPETLQQTMADLKSTIPGSLSTLTQPRFYLSNHVTGIMGGPGGALPCGKGSQIYGLGPDLGGKLHHQNHVIEQQQQQQQQQHHHHHHHPHHPQHQQQQQQQHQTPTSAQIHQHDQQQQQQAQHRVPIPHFLSVESYPPPIGGIGGQHIPNEISPPLSHMGSMSNIPGQASKKRKYSSGSPPGTVSAGMMHAVNGVLSIKQEPHGPGPHFSSYLPDSNTLNDSDSSAYEIDANGMYIDNTYRVIKWQPFSKPHWVELLDDSVKIVLMTPEYRVDADKGFNFSAPDDAFVCQKKNHFQITVHIRIYGNAKYLRTHEGAIKKIEYFSLDFYGVKMESQNQKIKIEQSLSDRSKKLFYPVKVDILPDKETKKTEGRLHFSETTSNNMRKKNMPNPDQRFFLLVVSLNAHSGDKDYVVVDSVSEKIIVRASNPGQFDNNSEVLWLKGQTSESVYHRGRVGINTDRPDEALTVHGNMRLTGILTQPSDMRAKENIQEIDPKHQLKNVSQLKLYKFSYNEQYAVSAGIPEKSREDTGVLAQEIMEIMPDAVQETGDFVLSNGETIENFLVLNKDRLFMENVGAVKELAKLTDNLNSRIQELEKMNKRLGKLKRFGSLKSNVSWVSEISCSTLNTVSSMVIHTNTVEDSVSCEDDKKSRTRNKEKNADKTNGKSSTTSSSKNHHHHHHPHHPHQHSNSTHTDTTYSSRSHRGSSGRHSTTNGNNSSSSSSNNIGSDSGNGSINTSSASLSSSSWWKGPLSQTTKSLFKNRCLPVIIIMAFCLVAAMTLYIVEKTRPDNHHSAHPVVQGQSNAGSTSHGSNKNSSAEGGRISPFPDRHRTTPLILPTRRTTTPSLPRTTPTTAPSAGPETEPVVPPWPVCHANSCEKLCCPPENDDQPIIVIHNQGANSGASGVNYNIEHNGGRPSSNEKGGSKTKDDTNVVMPSGNDIPISTVQVEHLPNHRKQERPSANSIAYQVPKYHVFTNNRRRKRSAEFHLSRPHIRIVELNFTLDDQFCLVDRCSDNSYSYYVKLHPYFGFDNVTLELTTPSTMYIAMCSLKFVNLCPPPASNASESGSTTLQQTNVARWQIMIGSHFKTEIQFKLVHSVKGTVLPMNNACNVTTNEDFEVMTYDIMFERSC